MKVFQILGDICHWDASVCYNTIEETVGRYPEDIVFVEAPDNVFEGWGYIDGQFIKPTPPKGWLYDDETGTFYQPGYKPQKLLTMEELAAENKLLKAQIQAQSVRSDFVEDCVAEMATLVYV